MALPTSLTYDKIKLDLELDLASMCILWDSENEGEENHDAEDIKDDDSKPSLKRKQPELSEQEVKDHWKRLYATEIMWVDLYNNQPHFLIDPPMVRSIDRNLAFERQMAVVRPPPESAYGDHLNPAFPIREMCIPILTPLLEEKCNMLGLFPHPIPIPRVGDDSRVMAQIFHDHMSDYRAAKRVRRPTPHLQPPERMSERMSERMWSIWRNMHLLNFERPFQNDEVFASVHYQRYSARTASIQSRFEALCTGDHINVHGFFLSFKEEFENASLRKRMYRPMHTPASFFEQRKESAWHAKRAAHKFGLKGPEFKMPAEIQPSQPRTEIPVDFDGLTVNQLLDHRGIFDPNHRLGLRGYFNGNRSFDRVYEADFARTMGEFNMAESEDDRDPVFDPNHRLGHKKDLNAAQRIYRDQNADLARTMERFNFDLTGRGSGNGKPSRLVPTPNLSCDRDRRYRVHKKRERMLPAPQMLQQQALAQQQQMPRPLKKQIGPNDSSDNEYRVHQKSKVTFPTPVLSRDSDYRVHKKKGNRG